MKSFQHHPLQGKIRYWNDRIAAWKESGTYLYFRTFDGITGTTLTVGGNELLNFSTYSYLNLNGDPRIAAAVKQAVDRYGTGTIASFVSGGGFDLHNQLKEQIRRFTGREDVVLFTSGFVANVSTITALIGEGDWVIADTLNHASLHEGCGRSGGVFKLFRHHDLAGLEKLLKRAQADQGGSLVVCDAVYSMDGDVLNLPAVHALCQRYNALLMVDEAHSVGVLGAHGHGIEEHFGMPGAIQIKMGTLSKTIPANGGYIAGDQAFIDFLRFAAKGHLFSGAITPANAAAALEGLRLIEVEGGELIARLQANIAYFKRLMGERGFVLRADPLPPGVPDIATPIVPVMVYEEEKGLRMSQYCFDHGLFIIPASYPVVPKGKARLRATLTAGHTQAQIERAVELIDEAAHVVGAALAPVEEAGLAAAECCV